MNCPSRPDNVEKHPDWNQSPQDLNSDATTRADLNGIVNQRSQREHEISISLDLGAAVVAANEGQDITAQGEQGLASGKAAASAIGPGSSEKAAQVAVGEEAGQAQQLSGEGHPSWPRRVLSKGMDVMFKYAAFVGPGFLIAVAYIDPGNYATDVSAGAQTKYAHLFIILMSNLFAVFLQSLCIKLGSVTGLNLAENCRKHLPRWLVWGLWLVSEAAIVATDVAEVIGTAIALNLLLKIPLIAGCAISIVDVFILLIFYNPDGSMTRLRVFEYFVMALVLGVVVCFCIQLSYIQNTSVGEVFRGYVPSSAVVNGNGIYLSCGIIGATVMPHSIFLGSGVVQPRLRLFDEHCPETINTEGSLEEKYIPSVGAIRSCLKYSIVELAFSLFTFALFVNSAILIVAGSSLYNNPDAPDADLFGIHDLLSKTLAPAAGVVFALALLLSGTSAGIVCTMAGQMVSEGMIQWTIKPWMRRLATRTLSIIPSIIVAAAVGRKGLDNALNNSQVALSVALPFVTAPLVYFTCKSSIMTVTSDAEGRRALEGDKVNMRNGWIVATLAILIWLVLVVMNVALIVLAGLGKG